MSNSSIPSIPCRKSISKKKSILLRWEQSNLSMKEYCEQEGISVYTLKYWIGQFDMGCKRKRKNNGFVPLEVSPEVSAGASTPFAEVIAVNSSRVLLHKQVPPSYLNELLSARI